MRRNCSHEFDLKISKRRFDYWVLGWECRKCGKRKADTWQAKTIQQISAGEQ